MAKNKLVKLLGTTAAAALLAVALGGCGSSSASSSEGAAADDNVIKVGASPSPHAEILAAASDVLADEGYELEVVEFNDYVQPNVALSEGELDANFFQHLPYLEDYNAENGTDLQSAGAIHFEPMTIYAGTCENLDAIEDGAVIAVPSDATNEARALLLLEEQGIITLKDGVGLAATANDIKDNPHNVEIKEAEAASLPTLLPDCALAVINGNFALSAGLGTDKALVSESADSEAAQTYGNVIAVRADSVDSDKTKALVNALQSETIREYIENNYEGAVVPVF